MPEAVIVWPRGPEGRARLERLARELALELHEQPPVGAATALSVVSGRLVLVDLLRRESAPVTADLSARAARLAKLPALLRAVGQPAGFVVDGTAGLGRDASTLAEHCAKLVLVERDAVLHALLADALETARREPRGAAGLRSVELVQADARAWLADLPPAARPDVVYLDPMYPERKKALPKADLQMLQRLLGRTADDDRELLLVARSVARRRVVVKRPPRAAPLAPDVHHALETKLVRFDVYEAR